MARGHIRLERPLSLSNTPTQDKMPNSFKHDDEVTKIEAPAHNETVEHPAPVVSFTRAEERRFLLKLGQ